jgi:hypothetical protein
MAFVRHIGFVLTLGLLAAMAWPFAAAAQSGKTIYCCDIDSRPLCGDILQRACYGRSYREISPQGTVRRRVDAPVTAAELSRRETEIQAQKEAEEQAKRQARLDRALLDAYPSLADLDRRHDYEMGAFERTISNLAAQEEKLLERRRSLDLEVEALNGKPVPPELEEAIRSADGDAKTHRQVIEARKQERDATRKRFDDDRRRYLELTSPEVKPLPNPRAK